MAGIASGVITTGVETVPAATGVVITGVGVVGIDSGTSAMIKASSLFKCLL